MILIKKQPEIEKDEYRAKTHLKFKILFIFLVFKNYQLIDSIDQPFQVPSNYNSTFKNRVHIHPSEKFSQFHNRFFQ